MYFSYLLSDAVISVWQVNLSEDYLECVAKQQETLRPFGDIPRDMKGKVSRSFVTARSFVQGLLVSADVVRKVSQVSVLLLFFVLWDINLHTLTSLAHAFHWGRTLNLNVISPRLYKQ